MIINFMAHYNKRKLVTIAITNIVEECSYIHQFPVPRKYNMLNYIPINNNKKDNKNARI